MKKKHKRICSLIMAFAMIINILLPNLSYADSLQKSKNSVTFSVERRVLGENDIIKEKEVMLTDSKPEKASYVLDRLLKAEGIAYDNTGSLDSNFYLSWLDTNDGKGGLGEFDHGEHSGWKYSVNGIFPSVGFSDYTLQPGDKVRVCYTAKDMGNDILLVDKLDSLKNANDNAKSLKENEYTTESYSTLKEAINVSDEKIAKYQDIGPMLSTLLGDGNLDIDKAINEDIQPSIDSLENSIENLEKSTEVPEIPEEVPTPEYQVHLKRSWTDFDKIYLREDQDSIAVSLKWVEDEEAKLNDGIVKPIDPSQNPYGDEYIAILKKGTNKITIIDWVNGVKESVDRYIYVEEMNYSIKGNVAPGETVTLQLEGLEAQLTDNKTHPLKESKTVYSTDIPGLKQIQSENILGENPDGEKLSNITFTIPNSTETGEYKLTKGNVYHKFGGVSINGDFKKEFSRLPEIILNVNDGIDESKVYDVDLSKWTEYDKVYTTEDKAYIRVNGKVKELNIGSNTINVDGQDYEINCKKVSYKIEDANQIVPGSKVTIKFDGLEEAFKYIPGLYNPYKIKTRYSSDISGLEDVDAISSATAGGMGGSDVNREALNTIEFTIPEDTTPGEYNLNSGIIYQAWYGNSINGKMENDFSKLPNIKINVKEALPEDTTAPTIETSLKDNTTVTSSGLSFTAYAKDETDTNPKLVVKLDGEVITTNRPGRYEVKLLEGQNIITLEATDKSGNTTTQNYTITCSPVLKEGDSIILDKEHLRLQVGDIHNIIAVDAPDKRSSEKEDVARMTYDVIEGNDVVKVNKYGKVEALKLGNAKISVKYPGLKQPGIITINVVEDKNSDNPKIITSIKETKYDTFYYTNGNSEYSFEVNSPEADNIEVKVNDAVITDNEGKYSFNLQEGSNTIYIKATNGSTVNEKYYNIKAKPLTITVKNLTNEGSEIVQGDKVRVQFKGLETPVPKFLRVFNPKNTRVEYETNIPGMDSIYGEGSQYDIATKNAIEFIATQEGTFDFTSGCIDEAWWGDELYSERDIYNEGPNLDALVRKEKFLSLPQFSITVKENDEFTPKYTTEIENEADIKPGNEVVIKVPQLEMPETGNCQISQAKTIFDTNIPGLKNVESQEAKDNHENLKEIRFTLPENVQPGTYTITNGRVFKEWLPNTSSLYQEGEFYKGELPQINIEVKEDNVVLPPVNTSNGIDSASKWILENNANPGFEDEWKILGLARGEVEVPGTYFKTYYSNLEEKVIEKKGELSRNKYTEYSRVILALTALGYDPTNVGGYNLVEKLYDLNNVSKQGINGVIFALIALDSKNYEIKGDLNSREMMVNYIVERQLEDGGFALSGNKGEIDITAMAVQALARYQDKENVKSAINKAVNFLSENQLETGGYAAKGSLLKEIIKTITNKDIQEENLESSAQVLVAINALGMDANNEKFVKNNKTIVDAMMKFVADNGGFKHLLSDKSANSMATEQALYALASQNRLSEGKTSLYDMNDVQDVKPEIPDNNEAPKITASDKVINVGDEFNPMDGVSASDKEDGDLTKDIKVVEITVNTKVAGEYKVVYEVTDSKGLKATKEITVIVKEVPVPTDKKLKVGVYTDEKALFESIEVEYKEGDTAYTVLKRILGDKVASRGENETLYVEGIDDLYEFDKGAQSGWVYAVNRVKPNVSAGIYDLNPGDEMIWHYTVDLGEDIENSYKRFDEFLKGQGEVVPPAQNQAPVINASDVELKLNDKFEPLNGVTATDKEDGDLTKEIKVVENTVDTSKEGIYKVVYEVEDSQGLKTTKEIKVVVIKEIEKVDVSSLVKNASDWVLQNIKSPTFGDEWKIFGLSRGNVEVPKNYYETYYNNVVKEVKEKDGELSRNKYTEYSRLIIALTSLGYDPTNVGGYNLVEKIYDLDKVTKQGINGAIFALIALDTNNYEIKGNSNSREAMIDFILDRQLSDGGFALSGDKGEVDITAMAIQSLAKYKDLENVNKAIEKALEFLSSKQLKTGGYATEEGENLESSAQVLVAINELGISAKDERFMKNGKTIVDAMARFAASEGGYKHALTESEANSMATEQALYSLVSQSRLNEGKTSLYDMTDISDEVNPPQPPTDQEEEDGEEEEEDDDGEGINPPTNPNGGNKNPQTSDTSIMHFLGLVVLASVSLIVVNRKKMNN